jgi:hypothetical protein
MQYSIAYDAQNSSIYVMEKSTDFDGWVVLYHCHDFRQAVGVKEAIEKTEKECREMMERKNPA